MPLWYWFWSASLEQVTEHLAMHDDAPATLHKVHEVVAQVVDQGGDQGVLVEEATRNHRLIVGVGGLVQLRNQRGVNVLSRDAAQLLRDLSNGIAHRNELSGVVHFVAVTGTLHYSLLFRSSDFGGRHRGALC